MNRSRRDLMAIGLGAAVAAGGIWAYAGAFGFHVLVRNGVSYWLRMRVDDPRLSPSMRLALMEAPAAIPGPCAWRDVAPGFEVGEMAAIAKNREVDRLHLARIDPMRFRFEVLNSAAGDKDLDEWMTETGAGLVVNAGYFGNHGEPTTPVLSKGAPLGPAEYRATAGAFVATTESARVTDLAGTDWKTAFRGAQNALVSYPLLLAADGTNRVPADSRWLASRSFIGQDKDGRIVIGTTADAFFSLSRLAEFLRQAPLNLETALNLDGGPVACQGIALGGYERRVYGKWEVQVTGETVSFLRIPHGNVAMPNVLAVFTRA